MPAPQGAAGRAHRANRGVLPAQLEPPELDHEELLHAHPKRAVTAGAPTRSKRSLCEPVIGWLRRLPKLPERIRRYYYEHDLVRFAA